MITVTVYYKDKMWRVKRSDKEIATFTDGEFKIAMIVGMHWALEHNARLILIGQDGIGVGQLDIFRAFNQSSGDDSLDFLTSIGE